MRTIRFWSLSLLTILPLVACTPAGSGNTTPPGEEPPQAGPAPEEQPRESQPPPLPSSSTSDPGIGASSFSSSPAATSSGDAVPQAEMDNFIKGMIKGGLQSRPNVLKSGTFSAYNVYRDGQADGVVFEYVFDRKVTLPATGNAAAVRASLVKGLHAKKVMQSMGRYMKAGLYLRYRYLRSDLSALIDLKITYDDMK